MWTPLFQPQSTRQDGRTSRSLHDSYRRVRSLHTLLIYADSVYSMFKQTQFSDITIYIHGKALPAHRFVVCIQSKFFHNAFCEDNFAEGETKTMKLDAATEAAYWRVFEYMYTGDYPDQLSDIGTKGRRPTYLYYSTLANIRQTTHGICRICVCTR